MSPEHEAAEAQESKPKAATKKAAAAKQPAAEEKSFSATGFNPDGSTDLGEVKAASFEQALAKAEAKGDFAVLTVQAGNLSLTRTKGA